MNEFVQSVIYRPVHTNDGRIAHVARLTRWYGGREVLDIITATDYQTACDMAGIADHCAAIDGAVAAMVTQYGGNDG